MAPANASNESTISLAVNGPALFYVSSLNSDDLQRVHRADLETPTDPRERAIFRAILQHALAILDASEPARARAGTAERA